MDTIEESMELNIRVLIKMVKRKVSELYTIMTKQSHIKEKWGMAYLTEKGKLM